MEDTRAEALPIGAAEAAAALQTLQRYKAGKAALDKRLIDNELWFRMGHWKNYRDPLMPGKAQPSSGWLFNSIANKHADAMDNYPEPMVLPRAADDQATAQALSSVLPVVLEQADYEQVYTAMSGGASSNRAPVLPASSGTRRRAAGWATLRCAASTCSCSTGSRACRIFRTRRICSTLV